VVLVSEIIYSVQTWQVQGQEIPWLRRGRTLSLTRDSSSGQAAWPYLRVGGCHEGQQDEAAMLGAKEPHGWIWWKEGNSVPKVCNVAINPAHETPSRKVTR
jgi:hypothetical protein